MTTGKNDNQDLGPHVIADIGGDVDETLATLGIYGHDLEPEEISAALGCSATSSHRRGDIRGAGPPYAQGAWLLRVEGKAPVAPDELVQRLLDMVPADLGAWEQLNAKYNVRFGVAVFISNWSRGFELSPSTIKRISSLGLGFGVTIYADDGE